jgi:hypothetical protein
MLDNISPVLKKYLSTILLSAVTATGLVSCSDSKAPEATAQTAPAITKNTKPFADALSQLQTELKPAPKAINKLAMLVDKSKSMDSELAEPVKITDLQQAIDSANGIEVAASKICTRNPASLERGKFEPQSKLPDGLSTPIIDNSETVNPHLEEEETKKVQEEVTKKVSEIKAFTSKLAADRAKQQQDIKQYLAKVNPILTAKNDCNTTAIHHETDKVNRFFEEPVVDSAIPTNKYLLIVTDGLDEYDSKTIKFTDPKVQVLVVHGGEKIGVLAKTPNVIRFANVYAAMEFITKKMKQ